MAPLGRAVVTIARGIGVGVFVILVTMVAGEPMGDASEGPSVEILDTDELPASGGGSTTVHAVELVGEEPAPQVGAAIEDVQAAKSDDKKTDSRVFGRSRIWEESDPTLGPSSDFELRPLSQPFSIVQVILEPVREVNLLLPKTLDPFAKAPQEESIPTEDEERRNKEIIDRLKKQRELLGTSGIFRNGPAKLLNNGWRFQAQAGGSFRAGNNSAGNVNSQLRVERHSLGSNFMARLQAFYTQVEEGDANRRVFGETNFDRNLRGHWICYVRQELEYDEARLLDLRSVSSGGIGFRFIDAVYERLIARTGPTASYIDYGETDDAAAEFSSGWLIEGEYRRVLGETSRFEMTSTMYPDFDSEQEFRIRTECAVLFPIATISPWNWKVGVRHEYILDPVADTNPNDVEGYFSIVYTR